MSVAKSQKILSSKEEIKEYLGGVSDYLFNKYVKLGMPARYEDNRWCAHADNIDNFFRQYTLCSARNVIDEIVNEGTSK